MTTFILILARTLHLGSAMLLVALPFFLSFVARSDFDGAALERKGSLRRGILGGCWWALIVEAISGVAWFWLSAAQMNDQSPWGVPATEDLEAVLWQTQFGWLWMARGALGLVLAFILHAVSRRRGFLARRILQAAMLLFSGLLLITLVGAGHAGAGIHDRAFHFVVDALHLVFGAIWPMGLIPLGYALWCYPAPSNEAIALLRRFSQASGWAVLILVVTGLVNSWLSVGSWSALVTTTYGALLVGKIMVVGIMIGLGMLNRFYLLARGSLTNLRCVVVVESVLALVVLLIVGIMGLMAPPL